MTEEEKQSMLKLLKEQYVNNALEAENRMEANMLKREYEKNVELLEAGNNIFANNKPNDSDYECIGCGA